MQGMVDAFNASQDEVHVNHTPMTADDLYQKILLTVQTGTSVPDVAIVHIERIPNFVDKEMLYAKRGLPPFCFTIQSPWGALGWAVALLAVLWFVARLAGRGQARTRHGAGESEFVKYGGWAQNGAEDRGLQGANEGTAMRVSRTEIPRRFQSRSGKQAIRK